MSKYIDAEKLKAEVEKRREDIKAYCLNPNHDKRYDVVPEQLAYILDIIDSIQQEQSEVDLEAFRREAAKDILCAILSTKTTAGDSDIVTAIEIADELIKQLKEEKK